MIVGDTHTCTIQTLAYGGDGIARIDGRVVFVPETIPGETVSVGITQVKKTFARGRVIEVLAPSPDRITPCCRVGTDARVPGCVYDHLSYAAELAAKQSQLEGFFRRIPHETNAFLPPVASPAPLHYRNKITLHADGAKLGYHQEPEHRVLDIPACPLADPAINDALHQFRETGGTQHWLNSDDDLVLRATPHDGVAWWTSQGVCSPDCPELLTEQSPAGALKVPRDGFYQVNPAVGDALVRFAADTFAENTDAPDILDLYCGVGVFGLACAKQGGRKLIGIESGSAAIAAARQNARALGVEGRFMVHILGKEPIRLNGWVAAPRQTTIIVDPPREGMDKSTAQALAASGAARIFYVSCDPATLARDLNILLADGKYRVRRIRLFDMFPRTAHFETFVELC